MLAWDLLVGPAMQHSDREEAHVERAHRTHKSVMEAMTRERPGTNMYTWRDRYLALFRTLWDKHDDAPPADRAQ